MRADEGTVRDALSIALDALVGLYGLPLVYEVIRERDGFCGNCGVPEEPECVHRHNGFGSCWIEKENADA